VVYDRKRLMDEGLALEIDDEGHLSAAGMLTIAMDVTFDLDYPWTGRKRAFTVAGELLRLGRLHGLPRVDYYRLRFAWRKPPKRVLTKACEVLSSVSDDEIMAALARGGFNPMGTGDGDD
jgi:hypothetical protein